MKDQNKVDQVTERIGMVAAVVLSVCGLAIIVAFTYRVVTWIL